MYIELFDSPPSLSLVWGQFWHKCPEHTGKIRINKWLGQVDQKDEHAYSIASQHFEHFLEAETWNVAIIYLCDHISYPKIFFMINFYLQDSLGLFAISVVLELHSQCSAQLRFPTLSWSNNSTLTTLHRDHFSVSWDYRYYLVRCCLRMASWADQWQRHSQKDNSHPN